jgi:hypothetical protein
MAAERGQKSQGWSKRQRESFLQRSESGEAGVESPPAGRRRKEKIILFQNGRDEKEAHLVENRERPEQPDK